MAKAFALYNPIAGHGQKDETISKLKEVRSEEHTSELQSQ